MPILYFAYIHFKNEKIDHNQAHKVTSNVHNLYLLVLKMEEEIKDSNIRCLKTTLLSKHDNRFVTIQMN